MSGKWHLSNFQLVWSPTVLHNLHQRPLVRILCIVIVISILSYNVYLFSPNSTASLQRIPSNAHHILSQCAYLKAVPRPPTNFLARSVSDRFEPGTNPTLIRNATIWTGERNGTVTIHGDLLFDGGIIKGVGRIPENVIVGMQNLTVVDADGAWVTPGLVDLHSHVGLLSAPFLSGTFDVNSPNGPIVPWLRSIDAFNTHDDNFRLAIAGGVTSVQVLPGSGNAIGGQAFMIKLRKTAEKSPSSMIIEPPLGLNGTDVDLSSPPRWRHMKQACGENLRRYGTRMDSVWALRSAYNEARNVKAAQDEYCQKAEAGLWESLEGGFPESLKWEVLVDVLRGRVKISNHCYEAVDLDNIVRLSNEFQFNIASFHHASEAWLVPDLLKKTWGGPPAIAIFTTNHRYKRESYRGSEFAGRILADNGIPVVMKSDHPVTNSRYLLHEAQQAFHFSLPPQLALGSVTSVPAAAAGLSHRIGTLHDAADADVVLWDSCPLQLGATPVKVWIDGVLQIPIPSKSGAKDGHVVIGKGKEGPEWKKVPNVPDWDGEKKRAIDWEGLPPLQGTKKYGTVVFRNVTEVWTRSMDGDIEDTFCARSLADAEMGIVIVERGRITCVGNASSCAPSTKYHDSINLLGGSIFPGLMSFGSPLGLEEIAGEPSTGAGDLHDAFLSDVPNILGDAGGVVRTVDALQFRTRNALTAYWSGVTSATSSFFKKALFDGQGAVITGLSSTFRTGSAHALENGAILQEISALHITVGRQHPYSDVRVASISTQIAGLRRLLSGWESKETETGYWFEKAAMGVIPLVIDVNSVDLMSTLLTLKNEIEERRGTIMRMVFAGATEAHLLAEELGRAGVGVILTPLRPFPTTWETRRILEGPPLTNDTALVTLLENGVTVALGVAEAWQARNTRFDLSWAALESSGRIGKRQAYALASTNLEKLLGIDNISGDTADLVVYHAGNAFELSSKVMAVISPQRGFVELI